MDQDNASFHGNSTGPKDAPDAATDVIADAVDAATVAFMDLYIYGVATCLLSIFGTLSNVINFVVFLKQQSNNCVTICLRSLTISDFFCMLLTLFSSLSSLVKRYFPGLFLDPQALQYSSQWGRAIFFDISMATTAFISLERCFCVIMPFHFKNIFTKRVAIVVLVFIYIFTFGSYSPIIASQGFTLRYDPYFNKTRILLWVSSDRLNAEQFSNIFTHIIFATTFQTIVVLSTHVMVIGLKRSAKFRHRVAGKSTAVTVVGNNLPIENDSSATNTDMAHNEEPGLSQMKSPARGRIEINPAVEDGQSISVRKQGNMSAKNMAVSKMVSILATIFILCNFVRLTFVYARQVNSEISPTGQLPNTYLFFGSLWTFVGTFNCSTNIFVYYFFNPSFKATLLSTFCPCSVPSNGNAELESSGARSIRADSNKY